MVPVITVLSSGFIIFIVAIFKPIKKIFLKNIDEKINDIKNSIDQAEKLRKDAQKTLIEIKKHQNVPCFWVNFQFSLIFAD